MPKQRGRRGEGEEGRRGRWAGGLGVDHLCHVCLELLYAVLKAGLNRRLQVCSALARVGDRLARVPASRRRRSQQCSLRLLTAAHFAVPQLVAAGAGTLNSCRSPSSCKSTHSRQLKCIDLSSCRDIRKL